MTKKIVVSVAGIVLVAGAIAVDAAAGYRVPATPAVTFQRDSLQPGLVTVKGSLGAAHNANNANIFIECRIRGYGDSDAGNASYEAECRANTGTFAAGQEPYCWVDNSDMNLLQAIVSVNGASYIEFKYDDGISPMSGLNHRCSEITVENNSKYVAKNADVLTVYKREVAINTSVTGALGSARNSTDNRQQIGCEVFSESFKQGSCWATDANGLSLSCSTERPNTIFSMSAIKPDSLVEFSGDTNAGECGGRLEINNSSKWRPAY